MIQKIKTEGWALPLMFGEIYLLPFWHVGPIPFKVSFFYIAFSLMRKLPKHTFVIPFLLIIFLLWIGKFFSFLFYGEYEFFQTIYATMNYSLIVMGFLYGFKTKSITNVNWLFPLSVLYSIINIYVFVSGMTNHALMAFYGLLDRVEEGLFLVRNPGIITNPNSSALAGNVILIFWVVARKFNLITYKKGLVDILVFISIGVALVSFQSRGGFLAFGATLFFYVKEQLNIARFIYVLGVATIFIIMLVNILPKIFPDQLEVFELGVLKVLEINNEITGELEKDASSDGSRIYKVKAAFDNFILSPIFGVGSDRTTGSPLNTVWYHNDWSEMLVSTGIIGFLMLLYVFVKVYKIHAAFAIPFIFGGMTNSFIVTVQIVMFYFLFVGIVVKLRGLKV